MAKRSKVISPPPDINELDLIDIGPGPETNKGQQEELGVAENLTALMKEYKTKSAVIRYLWGKGYTRTQIHKFMGIRYQHVRNVLTMELKRPIKTDNQT